MCVFTNRVSVEHELTLHFRPDIQARKVYTTALSMFCAALNASAGTPASATATSVAACSLHTDMAFLFWSFAETELSLYDTQSTDATARLAVRGPASVALILAATIDGQLPPIVSLADQSLALPPATRLLKCRNGFEALLRRGSPSELSWRADLPAAVRNGPPSPPDLYPCMLPASARAYTAVCYVWLEYLCSGLDAALRVFNEHVFAYIRGPDEKEPTGRRSRWNESTQSQMADPRDAWVARGSLQHEWLLCMYVRLLVWHSSRFAMSPRLLRSSLRRAVQVRVLRTECVGMSSLTVYCFVMCTGFSQQHVVPVSPRVDGQAQSRHAEFATHL
mgnify:CR=1 FL=1